MLNLVSSLVRAAKGRTRKLYVRSAAQQHGNEITNVYAVQVWKIVLRDEGVVIADEANEELFSIWLGVVREQSALTRHGKLLRWKLCPRKPKG